MWHICTPQEGRRPKWTGNTILSTGLGQPSGVDFLGETSHFTSASRTCSAAGRAAAGPLPHRFATPSASLTWAFLETNRSKS